MSKTHLTTKSYKKLQGKHSNERQLSLSEKLLRALTAVGFVLAPWAMAPVADAAGEIVRTGQTENLMQGGKADIYVGAVASDSSANIGLNTFKTFNVDNSEIANMHFNQQGSNNYVNTLFNFVNSQINIQGTVNAIKNNKIGGNLVFLSPQGMIVGPSGVINAGQLTVMTPSKNFCDDDVNTAGTNQAGEFYTKYWAAIQSGDTGLNPEGTIVVKGTINTAGGMTLKAPNITVGDGTTGHGTLRSGVDFNAIVNTGLDSTNLQGSAVNAKLEANNDGSFQLLVAKDNNKFVLHEHTTSAKVDGDASINLEASNNIFNYKDDSITNIVAELLGTTYEEYNTIQAGVKTEIGSQIAALGDVKISATATNVGAEGKLGLDPSKSNLAHLLTFGVYNVLADVDLQGDVTSGAFQNTRATGTEALGKMDVQASSTATYDDQAWSGTQAVVNGFNLIFAGNDKDVQKYFGGQTNKQKVFDFLNSFDVGLAMLKSQAKVNVGEKAHLTANSNSGFTTETSGSGTNAKTTVKQAEVSGINQGGALRINAVNTTTVSINDEVKNWAYDPNNIQNPETSDYVNFIVNYGGATGVAKVDIAGTVESNGAVEIASASTVTDKVTGNIAKPGATSLVPNLTNGSAYYNFNFDWGYLQNSSQVTVAEGASITADQGITAADAVGHGVQITSYANDNLSVTSKIASDSCSLFSFALGLGIIEADATTSINGNVTGWNVDVEAKDNLGTNALVVNNKEETMDDASWSGINDFSKSLKKTKGWGLLTDTFSTLLHGVASNDVASQYDANLMGKMSVGVIVGVEHTSNDALLNIGQNATLTSNVSDVTLASTQHMDGSNFAVDNIVTNKTGKGKDAVGAGAVGVLDMHSTANIVFAGREANAEAAIISAGELNISTESTYKYDNFLKVLKKSPYYDLCNTVKEQLGEDSEIYKDLKAVGQLLLNSYSSGTTLQGRYENQVALNKALARLKEAKSYEILKKINGDIGKFFDSFRSYFSPTTYVQFHVSNATSAAADKGNIDLANYSFTGSVGVEALTNNANILVGKNVKLQAKDEASVTSEVDRQTTSIFGTYGNEISFLLPNLRSNSAAAKGFGVTVGVNNNDASSSVIIAEGAAVQGSALNLDSTNNLLDLAATYGGTQSKELGMAGMVSYMGGKNNALTLVDDQAQLLAQNIINNTTTANGDVKINSTNNLNAWNIVGEFGSSGTKAVGASFGFMQYTNNSIAGVTNIDYNTDYKDLLSGVWGDNYTAANFGTTDTSITGSVQGGSVDIEAESEGTVENFTLAGTTSGTANDNAGGGDAAGDGNAAAAVRSMQAQIDASAVANTGWQLTGAGSVSLNIITGTTKALLENTQVTITPNSNATSKVGVVQLKASDDSDWGAYSGAAARTKAGLNDQAGHEVTLAGAAAANDATQTTLAQIKGAAITGASNIVNQAENEGAQIAIGLAFGLEQGARQNASGFDASVSGSINILDNDVQANILDTVVTGVAESNDRKTNVVNSAYDQDAQITGGVNLTYAKSKVNLGINVAYVDAKNDVTATIGNSEDKKTNERKQWANINDVQNYAATNLTQLTGAVSVGINGGSGSIAAFAGALIIDAFANTVNAKVQNAAITANNLDVQALDAKISLDSTTNKLQKDEDQNDSNTNNQFLVSLAQVKGFAADSDDNVLYAYKDAQGTERIVTLLYDENGDLQTSEDTDGKVCFLVKDTDGNQIKVKDFYVKGSTTSFVDTQGTEAMAMANGGSDGQVVLDVNSSKLPSSASDIENNNASSDTNTNIYTTDKLTLEDKGSRAINLAVVFSKTGGTSQDGSGSSKVNLAPAVIYNTATNTYKADVSGSTLTLADSSSTSTKDGQTTTTTEDASLKLNAHSKATIVNIAAGASFNTQYSSTWLSGAGSAIKQEVNNTTAAELADSTVKASTLDVEAKSEDHLWAVAGNADYSKATGAGLGLSWAQNSLNNTTGAYIYGTTMQAADESKGIAVTVKGTNATDTVALSAGGTFGESLDGNKLTLQGDYARNEGVNNTYAVVDESQTATDSSTSAKKRSSIAKANAIDVETEDNSTEVAVAGMLSIANSTKVGVGGAIAVNIIGTSDSKQFNQAALSNTDITTLAAKEKEITIKTEANDTGSKTAIALGVSVAGDNAQGSSYLSVDGDVAVNRAYTTTQATMDTTNVDKDTNNTDNANSSKVELNAISDATLVTTADTFAYNSGNAIMGMGIAYNENQMDTLAVLKGSTNSASTIKANSLQVKATSTNDITNVGIGVTGGKTNNAYFTLDGVGNFVDNTITNNTKAQVENANITSSGTTAVLADSEETIRNYIGSLVVNYNSGMGVNIGLGASVGLNTINGDTEASVTSSTITALGNDEGVKTDNHSVDDDYTEGDDKGKNKGTITTTDAETTSAKTGLVIDAQAKHDIKDVAVNAAVIIDTATSTPIAAGGAVMLNNIDGNTKALLKNSDVNKDLTQNNANANVYVKAFDDIDNYNWAVNLEVSAAATFVGSNGASAAAGVAVTKDVNDRTISALIEGDKSTDAQDSTKHVGNIINANKLDVEALSHADILEVGIGANVSYAQGATGAFALSAGAVVMENEAANHTFAGISDIHGENAGLTVTADRVAYFNPLAIGADVSISSAEYGSSGSVSIGVMYVEDATQTEAGVVNSSLLHWADSSDDAKYDDNITAANNTKLTAGQADVAIAISLFGVALGVTVDNNNIDSFTGVTVSGSTIGSVDKKANQLNVTATTKLNDTFTNVNIGTAVLSGSGFVYGNTQVNTSNVINISGSTLYGQSIATLADENLQIKHKMADVSVGFVGFGYSYVNTSIGNSVKESYTPSSSSVIQWITGDVKQKLQDVLDEQTGDESPEGQLKGSVNEDGSDKHKGSSVITGFDDDGDAQTVSLADDANLNNNSQLKVFDVSSEQSRTIETQDGQTYTAPQGNVVTISNSYLLADTMVDSRANMLHNVDQQIGTGSATLAGGYSRSQLDVQDNVGVNVQGSNLEAQLINVAAAVDGSLYGLAVEAGIEGVASFAISTATHEGKSFINIGGSEDTQGSILVGDTSVNINTQDTTSTEVKVIDAGIRFAAGSNLESEATDESNTDITLENSTLAVTALDTDENNHRPSQSTITLTTTKSNNVVGKALFAGATGLQALDQYVKARVGKKGTDGVADTSANQSNINLKVGNTLLAGNVFVTTLNIPTVQANIDYDGVKMLDFNGPEPTAEAYGTANIAVVDGNTFYTNALTLDSRTIRPEQSSFTAYADTLDVWAATGIGISSPKANAFIGFDNNITVDANTYKAWDEETNIVYKDKATTTEKLNLLREKATGLTQIVLTELVDTYAKATMWKIQAGDIITAGSSDAYTKSRNNASITFAGSTDEATQLDNLTAVIENKEQNYVEGSCDGVSAVNITHAASAENDAQNTSTINISGKLDFKQNLYLQSTTKDITGLSANTIDGDLVNIHGGVQATNTIIDSAFINLSGAEITTGGSIYASAQTNVDFNKSLKASDYPNYADSYIIAGAEGDKTEASNTITTTSILNIGAESAGGKATSLISDGYLTLEVQTIENIFSHTKAKAVGAFSFPGMNQKDTFTFTERINVNPKSTLTTKGDSAMTLAAWDEGNVDEYALSEVYSGLGSIDNTLSATINKNTEVNLADQALIQGAGTVNLWLNKTLNNVFPKFTLATLANGRDYDVKNTSYELHNYTYLTRSNKITVASGATVHSLGDIDLYARRGVESLSCKRNDENDDYELNTYENEIEINGTVTAGSEQKQTIIIGADSQGQAAEQIVALTKEVYDSIQDKNKAYVGDDNFYIYVDAENTDLAGTVASRGSSTQKFTQNTDSSWSNGTFTVGENNNVPTISLPDLTASDGSINISTNKLYGEGTLTANGNQEIAIENHTNLALQVNNITVSNTGSGITYDGYVLSGTQDEQKQQIKYINAALNESNANATVANINNNDDGQSGVTITSDFGGVITQRIADADTVNITESNPSADTIIKGYLEAYSVSVVNKNHDILIQGTTETSSAGINANNIALVAENGNIIQDATNGILNIGAGVQNQYANLYQEHITGIGRSTTSKIVEDTNVSATSTFTTVTNNCIAAKNITLTAKVLNLNGTVQSGFAKYAVDIPEEAATKINALQAAWDAAHTEKEGAVSAELTDAEVMSSGDTYRIVQGGIKLDYITKDDGTTSVKDGSYYETLDAYYNPATKQIIVPDVDASAGHITLTGQIINTGVTSQGENNKVVYNMGNIICMDGTYDITVNNATNTDLKLGKLKVNDVDGLIKINDNIEITRLNYYAGFSDSHLQLIGFPNLGLVYTPDSAYYKWNSSSETNNSKVTTNINQYWGQGASAHNFTYTYIEPEQTEFTSTTVGEITKDSFSEKNFAIKYTYSDNGNAETKNAGPYASGYLWKSDKENTLSQTEQTSTITQTYTASVKANVPISIKFIGNADRNSTVDITSQGNVQLTGDVGNAKLYDVNDTATKQVIKGTVNITGQGSIEQQAGNIYANNLTATAASGIDLSSSDNQLATVALYNSASGDIVLGNGGNMDLTITAVTKAVSAADIANNLTPGSVTIHNYDDLVYQLDAQGQVITDAEGKEIKDTTTDNAVLITGNVLAEKVISVINDEADRESPVADASQVALQATDAGEIYGGAVTLKAEAGSITNSAKITSTVAGVELIAGNNLLNEATITAQGIAKLTTQHSSLTNTAAIQANEELTLEAGSANANDADNIIDNSGALTSTNKSITMTAYGVDVTGAGALARAALRNTGALQAGQAVSMTSYGGSITNGPTPQADVVNTEVTAGTKISLTANNGNIVNYADMTAEDGIIKLLAQNTDKNATLNNYGELQASGSADATGSIILSAEGYLNNAKALQAEQDILVTSSNDGVHNEGSLTAQSGSVEIGAVQVYNKGDITAYKSATITASGADSGSTTNPSYAINNSGNIAGESVKLTATNANASIYSSGDLSAQHNDEDGNSQENNVTVTAGKDIKNSGDIVSTLNTTFSAGNNIDNTDASTVNAAAGYVKMLTQKGYIKNTAAITAGNVVVLQAGTKDVYFANNTINNSGKLTSFTDNISLEAYGTNTVGENHQEALHNTGEMHATEGSITLISNDDIANIIADPTEVIYGMEARQAITMTAKGGITNGQNAQGSAFVNAAVKAGTKISLTANNGNIVNYADMTTAAGNIEMLTYSDAENTTLSNYGVLQARGSADATGSVILSAKGYLTNAKALIAEQDISIGSRSDSVYNEGELTAQNGKVEVGAAEHVVNSGEITAYKSATITASGADSGSNTDLSYAINNSGNLSGERVELKATSGYGSIYSSGDLTAQHNDEDGNSQENNVTVTAGKDIKNSGDIVSTLNTTFSAGNNIDNTDASTVNAAAGYVKMLTQKGYIKNTAAITAGNVVVLQAGTKDVYFANNTINNSGKLTSFTDDISLEAYGTNTVGENPQKALHNTGEMHATEGSITLISNDDIANIIADPTEVIYGMEASQAITMTAKGGITNGQNAQGSAFVNAAVKAGTKISLTANNGNIVNYADMTTAAGNIEMLTYSDGANTTLSNYGVLQARGSADATGSVILSAKGYLTNAKALIAEQDISIGSRSDSVYNEGGLTAQNGKVEVGAVEQVVNSGDITAYKSATITASGADSGSNTDLSYAINNSGNLSGERVELKATSGYGSIYNSGDLSAQHNYQDATSQENNVVVTAGKDIINIGDLQASNNINITTTNDNISNSGSIIADYMVNMNAGKNIELQSNIVKGSGVDLTAMQAINELNGAKLDTGVLKAVAGNGLALISELNDLGSVALYNSTSGDITLYNGGSRKLYIETVAKVPAVTGKEKAAGNVTILNYDMEADNDVYVTGSVLATGNVTIKNNEQAIIGESAGKIKATNVTMEAKTNIDNESSITSTLNDVSLTAENNIINKGNLTAAYMAYLNAGANIYLENNTLKGIGIDLTADKAITESNLAKLDTGNLKALAENGIALISELNDLGSVALYNSTSGNIVLYNGGSRDLYIDTVAKVPVDTGKANTPGNVTIHNFALGEANDVYVRGSILADGDVNITNDEQAIIGESAGKIKATNVTMEAKTNIDNEASIIANTGEVSLTADNDITNSGTIVSVTNTTFTAGQDIVNTGTVTAGTRDTVITGVRPIKTYGAVNFAATRHLTNAANIDATNTVDFQTEEGYIDIQADSTEQNSYSISAAGKITLDSASYLSNAANITSTGGEISLSSDAEDVNTTSGDVTKAAIANTGFFYANKDISVITSHGSVDNKNLFLADTGNIEILSAKNIFNNSNATTVQVGLVTNAGDISATAQGGYLYNHSNISSAGSAILYSQDYTNNTGNITATNQISITSFGYVNNSGTLHSTDKYITLAAMGDVHNTDSGVITAATGADINSHKGDVTNAGDITLTAGNITVSAGDQITNESTGGNVENNGDYIITGQGNIDMQAVNHLSNTGKMEAVTQGDISLVSKKDAINNAQGADMATGNGSVTLEAYGNIDNQGDALANRGTIAIYSWYGDVKNYDDFNTIIVNGIEVKKYNGYDIATNNIALLAPVGELYNSKDLSSQSNVTLVGKKGLGNFSYNVYAKKNINMVATGGVGTVFATDANGNFTVKQSDGDVDQTKLVVANVVNTSRLESAEGDVSISAYNGSIYNIKTDSTSADIAAFKGNVTLEANVQQDSAINTMQSINNVSDSYKVGSVINQGDIVAGSYDVVDNKVNTGSDHKHEGSITLISHSADVYNFDDFNTTDKYATTASVVDAVNNNVEAKDIFVSAQYGSYALSTGDIVMSAENGKLYNDKHELVADGNVTLAAKEGLGSFGDTIYAGKNITLTATEGNLVNKAQLVSVTGDITLNATQGTVVNMLEGDIFALSGNVYLNAGGIHTGTTPQTDANIHYVDMSGNVGTIKLKDSDDNELTDSFTLVVDKYYNDGNKWVLIDNTTNVEQLISANKQIATVFSYIDNDANEQKATVEISQSPTNISPITISYNGDNYSAIVADVEVYRNGDVVNRGDIIALGTSPTNGIFLSSSLNNATNYDDFAVVNGAAKDNNNNYTYHYDGSKFNIYNYFNQYKFKTENGAETDTLITGIIKNLEEGKSVIASKSSITMTAPQGYFYNSMIFSTDKDLNLTAEKNLVVGKNFSVEYVGEDFDVKSTGGSVINKGTIDYVGKDITFTGATGVINGDKDHSDAEHHIIIKAGGNITFKSDGLNVSEDKPNAIENYNSDIKADGDIVFSTSKGSIFLDPSTISGKNINLTAEDNGNITIQDTNLIASDDSTFTNATDGSIFVQAADGYVYINQKEASDITLHAVKDVILDGRNGIENTFDDQAEGTVIITSDTGSVILSSKSLQGDIKLSGSDTQKQHVQIKAANGLAAVGSGSGNVKIDSIEGADVILYTEGDDAHIGAGKITVGSNLVIEGDNLDYDMGEIYHTGSGDINMTITGSKGGTMKGTINLKTDGNTHYNKLNVTNANITVTNGTLAIDKLHVAAKGNFNAFNYATSVYGSQATPYHDANPAIYYDGGEGAATGDVIEFQRLFNLLPDTVAANGTKQNGYKIGEERSLDMHDRPTEKFVGAITDARNKLHQNSGSTWGTGNDGWMNLYIDSHNYQRSNGLLLHIAPYYYSGYQRMALDDLANMLVDSKAVKAYDVHFTTPVNQFRRTDLYELPEVPQQASVAFSNAALHLAELDNNEFVLGEVKQDKEKGNN